MSRETDSSSSGPQGRGGAAYPSGTPPYGTRQYPSLHPQEEQFGADAGDPPGTDDDAPKPAPSEPRTETTLTTRVRINIPGSRPIPPVVVRTPVAGRKNDAQAAQGAEGKDTAGSDAAAAPGASGSAGPAGASSAPAAADPPGAPRPQPPAPGFGGGAAPSGAGSDGTQALPRWELPEPPSATGEYPAPSGTGEYPAPGFPGAGAAPSAPFGGARGGEEKPPPSDWFAPRRTAPPAGAPGFGDLPGGEAPGETGSGDYPPGGPVQFGPPPTRGGTPGERGVPSTPGTQPPPNIPFLTENPPPPAFHTPPGGAPEAPGDPYGQSFGGDRSFGGSDPFGGAGARFGRDDGMADRAPGAADPQAGAAHDSVPFPGFHQPDPAARPHLDSDRPAGPTAGPATGGLRPSAPETRSGYRPPRGPDSGPGDTLVGGVPRVPSPASATGSAEPPAAAASGGRPARKGRSKPMLLVGALGTIAVVAYGAGLLMDHGDVPNGTNVLGVDIGGDSTQQATQALDTAVGDRSNAPLKVRVGGTVQELKPELAGLAIDTDATVQSVAHRDYNPVSVIGSLFGGTHVVAPKVTVDQEKLRSQLQTLSGGTGTAGSGSTTPTATDGMVKFVNGTPVAVPGKPYQAVDADAAISRITAAYEQRAETGSDNTVDLPVTTHQPTVTAATLQQAIKTIGDPAMSGMITVQAGGRSVPFSPQKSLSKILTIVPVPGSGKMTLHIDLTVLQSLYGNAFDGVLLERGNGTKTPVTPQDVASAMLPALSKTAPAKTAPIPNAAG